MNGSTDVASNDVTLVALQVRPHSFGVFLTSETQWYTFPITASQGALCLGGSVGGFAGLGQIQNSGSAGEFSLAIDLLAMPTSTGFQSADPGETWSFQAWYRDANPTATTNFTDGVAVTFQ